ncbi:putative aminodeoxychorismate lyase [compost metagenome]
MNKSVRTLIIAALILVVLVGGGIGYMAYSFLKSPPGYGTTGIIFEVEPGKSFNTVAAELEQQGLVKNAAMFSLYARLTGDRAKLKVGQYELNQTMRPREVLDVIISGKSIAKGFTVSEGLSTYEIAELYQRQGYGTAEEFFRLTRDPQLIQLLLGEQRDSLEGYLFPETYMLTKFTDTRTLITNMVKRFLIVYGEVTAGKSNLGMTRHQIVTLASIIEKETGAPEERPMISSVFHNRLAKGMRLQTDPTVIYGKALVLGKIVINITKSDLLTPTPYNTYAINGLPPGPIANPGREALAAAIAPAQTDYLFFVSQNDGTHVFSNSYENHNKAVQRFQLNRKAREGKSWRDLNKNRAAGETK